MATDYKQGRYVFCFAQAYQYKVFNVWMIVIRLWHIVRRLVLYWIGSDFFLLFYFNFLFHLFILLAALFHTITKWMPLHICVPVDPLRLPQTQKLYQSRSSGGALAIDEDWYIAIDIVVYFAVAVTSYANSYRKQALDQAGQCYEFSDSNCLVAMSQYVIW